MIKKKNTARKWDRKKSLCGILMNKHGAECLSSELIRAAKLARYLVLNFDLLDPDHLKFCIGFPTAKKINLNGARTPRNSFKNVLKRVRKHSVSKAVIFRTNRGSAFRHLVSYAKYCANRSVHKGKTMFKRHSVDQLRGLESDSSPEFYFNESHASLRHAEALAIVKAKSHAFQTPEYVIRDNNGDFKIGNFSLNHQYKEEATLRSISLLPVELTESTLGWPLLKKIAPLSHKALRKSKARNMSMPLILQNQVDFHLNKMEVSSSSASPLTKESLQSIPGWPLLQIAPFTSLNSCRKSGARKMSVVQWVMSLPKRSISVTRQTQTGSVSNKIESDVERERCKSGDSNNENGSTTSGKLLKELELLIRTNLYGYRCFSYKELKSATSQFSSENLIGEGGCSNVYKGFLPCGRTVAIKILKSYKEARNDFYSEMDIISTLKHKHITSLIGVCVEYNYLISVYDFFPIGSLEENLHGNSNISVLSWEVRFKVAVAVAEALNYLHNECSRPVIHRDIKSSNILLSDDFQPQLSDFGLAIWGPTDSTHVIHSDVVGTFGYIAPEYFMRGRVSDKIDVYSFGVVLLELLSGRKPIGSETLKGQRSLVKWAKPLLESGDLEALLDPKLDGNLDVDQIHRMVLAASLCVCQSARLRPKVSQILKLLTGEKEYANEFVSSHVIGFKELENQDDDDLLPEFGSKRHMGSTLLKSENNTSSLSSSDTSLRSGEKTRHFMLKDYLKERQE